MLKHGNIFYKCLIDEEDCHLIEKYAWWVRYDKHSKRYYVSGYEKHNESHKFLQLHRIIMNCPIGLCVDHINHDGLDNRKCNLRIVTHAQNQQNRTGANINNKINARGVFFNKQTNKWGTQLKINGKKIYFGEYTNVNDAKQAAIEGRKKYLPFSTN